MDKRHNGYYASQFTISHVASLKTATPQTPVSIDNDSSSEDDDDDKKKPMEGEIRSLAAYFMFSEEEAANKLNISKSKLKRIKKRLNITRWPYRRVSVNMKKTNC
jgi:DNA invertase Pin-like site-specific DNA recombinase